MEIIDTQGKDIAVDIAKLEEMIQTIQKNQKNDSMLNFSQKGTADPEFVKSSVMKDLQLKLD